jgi:hypothetical protein
VNENWKQLRFPQIGEEFPVSLDNARLLLIQCLEQGRIHLTEHFKTRRTERNFTTLDVEKAVKSCQVLVEPKYSAKFENWVFRIEGRSENKAIEFRVALDLNEDLQFPLLIFITGIYKGDTKRRRNYGRDNSEDNEDNDN